MDIIERLKEILKRDEIIARSWNNGNEYGEDIECDIEDALAEIERLRKAATISWVKAFGK